MSKIVLFKDVNLNGNALVQTEADPNLMGWNDVVSSLIVVSGDWDLFKDANYSGTIWNVSATGGPNGDGVYLDFNDWGGTNDSISSLKPRG